MSDGGNSFREKLSWKGFTEDRKFAILSQLVLEVLLKDDI